MRDFDDRHRAYLRQQHEGVVDTEAVADWRVEFSASPVLQGGFGSVDAYIAHHIAAEFSKSPALQAEFGSLEIYSAYKLGVSSGRVRSLSKSRPDPFAGLSSPTSSPEQWQADYANSAAIRSEFPTEETYVAYMRAEVAAARRRAR